MRLQQQNPLFPPLWSRTTSSFPQTHTVTFHVGPSRGILCLYMHKTILTQRITYHKHNSAFLPRSLYLRDCFIRAYLVFAILNDRLDAFRNSPYCWTSWLFPALRFRRNSALSVCTQASFLHIMEYVGLELIFLFQIQLAFPTHKTILAFYRTRKSALIPWTQKQLRLCSDPSASRFWLQFHPDGFVAFRLFCKLSFFSFTRQSMILIFQCK